MYIFGAQQDVTRQVKPISIFLLTATVSKVEQKSPTIREQNKWFTQDWKETKQPNFQQNCAY